MNCNPSCRESPNNGFGVGIQAARDNLIGGTAPGARNICDAQGEDGFCPGLAP